METTEQKTTVEITKVDGDHLYHHYPNQTQPQAVYLELDPEERTLRADWNGEIGNAVPVSVWHGRIRRYCLPSPYFTDLTIDNLLDEIAPFCERVCDGYDSEWDGNNYVGQLTEDAKDAEHEIAHILEQADPDLNVMDADDYFEPVRDDILARVRTGENAEDVCAEMLNSDCVVDGFYAYVDDIREEVSDG